MKKNDFNNSDFETLLKNKMDELSSGVDCFDKISSKAFPDNNAKYSENQFTVSELENITGKKKGFRFIPMAALATAAALCILFIPKNNFLNTFFQNVNKNCSKKNFREVISELNEEIENGTYFYFDCSLDDYIKYDILVTPLEGCPFEESENENINVRVFVKMHGEIPTNQLYAVEYEGEYSEANYIAVADSKAKISDEELADFDSETEFPDISKFSLELVEKCFEFSDSEKFICSDSKLPDKDEPVSVASIGYKCLYKYEKEIYPLTSEIVYYSSSESSNSFFGYDINAFYNENGSNEEFDQSVLSNAWNNAVYFNDNSALNINEDKSYFIRTNDFSNTELTGKPNNTISCVLPYDGIFDDFQYTIEQNKSAYKIPISESGNMLYLSKDYLLANQVSIMSPINTILCKYLAVYFQNNNNFSALLAIDDSRIVDRTYLLNELQEQSESIDTNMQEMTGIEESLELETQKMEKELLSEKQNNTNLIED